MNQIVTPEISEVLKTLHYRPAVSIIMPFEPKINLETELMHKLKTAADKVELELVNNYPAEVAARVVKKLRGVISRLIFDNHKKSIVIYVSLLFEKVIYLDIAAEEKIIIDDSFEIRDLVFNNKQQKKFLVLLLSAKQCRLFAGDPTSLARIEFDIPESVYAFVNDTSERVSNFSDMQERRQITLHKFLYHIDTELDNVLNARHLPVFVFGAEKLIGHFKKFTKHTDAIIGYVHGNYDDTTLPKLEDALKPRLNEWAATKQKYLLNLLDEAKGKKKLAAGIQHVWHEAANHRGRLLLVEKNYSFAARHGGEEDLIEELNDPFDKVSFIRDAVDDVIEKILQNGGDVEFVDDKVLKDYDHIALIQYY